MRRLSIIASIFILVMASAQTSAQSSWPASKVKFTDADNLQQKFNAGDLGGVGVGTFASLPVSGASSGIFVVIDCIDDACATGGGSVWVQKIWDGSAWSNLPGSGTDLASVPTSTTVGITSSTGADATILGATGSNAGALTAADKTKLDGIETVATGPAGPSAARAERCELLEWRGVSNDV